MFHNTLTRSIPLTALCLIISLSHSNTTQAATINVPANQPTIQAGIGVAVNGDTVLVAPGSYVENIDFLGKSVVLLSTTGASATLLFPADSSLSVVRFTSLETRDSKLSGFTIDGAGVTIGIRCIRSSPTLEFSTVTNCATTGAIVCDSSSNALLENLTVSNNLTNGVTLGRNGTFSGKITINNCTFNDNAGDLLGGGLSALTDDSVIVRNSTFTSNTRYGLAILSSSFVAPGFLRIDSSLFQGNETGCYIDGASGRVTNSTFRLNSVNGIETLISSFVLFDNCLITNNPTGAFLQVGFDTTAFRDCIIQENSTGILTDCAPIAISGGIVSNNSDTGIAIRACQPSSGANIENVLIYNNGIGIDACCTDTIIVSGCTIVNNTAPLGSAIRARFLISVKVRNSIIAFNAGEEWISFEPGFGPPADTPIAISCSDIFANGSGGVPEIIASQIFSNSNFLTDPQFCDTALADFQLLSTSPCLPAGNICSTLVGALGVGCEPPCCAVPGDANDDGGVNIADVTFSIARIFSGGPAAPCADQADANGDNRFNIIDVTTLLAWIFATGPAPICGTTRT